MKCNIDTTGEGMKSKYTVNHKKRATLFLIITLVGLPKLTINVPINR